jgi:diguanylate cyclase (GGDEF)-like protein/PAS domain S-box-containing protein
MRLPPLLMRPSPLVLVVDDDRLMRTMARDTLEQEGWSVVEAEDGSQALERFHEDRPDLVLMDVEMPGRDGISVCREIRARYPDDPTPVLILTGAEDRGCIERAYEAGATDFAAKPPNWTILTHRVRFLLRASGNLRELHRSQALLADAQRLAKVGYWCWSAQAGRMEWSDEIYRIFGLEPGSIEPNPRNWWNLMHPDDRGVVREHARVALSEGGHYAVEHRVLLRDDAVKHVHQQAEMSQSERGGGRWLVGTLQDVTEQRQAQEKIRYLANFDGLTGLANRRHFLESLDLGLEDARADDEVLALLYLDLDRFKQINDSLGHAAGDELLRQVAEILRSHVRASDVVGRLSRSDPKAAVSRLGGDEFTILLRDVSTSEAAGEVARRILRDLPRAVCVEDRGIAATASLGIALFPEDGDDAETLMKNADTAMYHAKEGGRNSYQFFCTSMHRTSERRLHVEAALRRALDHGGLELHYQPRIDLATGRAVGLEALLRWTDPELGRVAPMEALEVAQAAGLLERVGEWNFETACAQIRTWQERGFEPLPVAVNVPPEQFADGQLYSMLTQILKRTGVRPQLIEVEITEHAVLGDDEQVALTLRDLRAIGIRVALDDFGTGYSSLGYLTRLPLDLLKLDRSFVRDVCGGGSASGVVRATIEMAKSLGLRVVAEGVDAEEQAAALRELGCDELQGFLVSPAVPGEEAEVFLAPSSRPD